MCWWAILADNSPMKKKLLILLALATTGCHHEEAPSADAKSDKGIVQTDIDASKGAADTASEKVKGNEATLEGK